jgi:hypothetical protein
MYVLYSPVALCSIHKHLLLKMLRTEHDVGVAVGDGLSEKILATRINNPLFTPLLIFWDTEEGHCWKLCIVICAIYCSAVSDAHGEGFGRGRTENLRQQNLSIWHPLQPALLSPIICSLKVIHVYCFRSPLQ